MSKLVRNFAEQFAVPVIMTLAYLFLLEEAEPSGIAKVLLGLAFGGVVLIWVLFRDLRAHANAARAAAVGEPDDLIAQAQDQIEGRMFARARAPFLVYLATGHYLKGEFDRALEVLDRAERERGLKPAWALLGATTRLGVLVERGEAAAARALYDRGIGPATRRMAGPGPRLLGVEALARVQFAEGDLATCEPVFVKMSGDVRLGPSTRALAHRYAGACADARGDVDTAQRRLADAAQLAPRTFAATPPPAVRAAAS